ncbi:hypothetical protein Huta_2217 [Halorhabdus utahensis DSM 12940]|uniref:Uncharacterized protein n=1 Tax=Halorhabdus utahensis (strain DSM 12940 / JCM 11049 / AX-2) TaxID=519442 RepID=C7NUM7_HALUD|nr:hypothetical protein Huta_2217 [Halorhabdus utahensis DSM 12940]
MQVTHYDTCQECGSDLESPTSYRRHAYCAGCQN